MQQCPLSTIIPCAGRAKMPCRTLTVKKAAAGADTSSPWMVGMRFLPRIDHAGRSSKAIWFANALSILKADTIALSILSIPCGSSAHTNAAPLWGTVASPYQCRAVKKQERTVIEVAKKRRCRRTGLEKAQHDIAVKIRKMTDEQICDLLDELENRQPCVNRVEDYFAKLDELKGFGGISVRTMSKLRHIAVQYGFIMEV